MFERFSPAARRVVVLANAAARSLTHDYMGTEHLGIAFLRLPETAAGAALSASGYTADTMEAEVRELVGETNEPGAHIPFTPRTRRTLEAADFATANDLSPVGTADLLAAMVGEGDGLAVQLWKRAGLDIDAVVADAVPEAIPTTATQSRLAPATAKPS